METEMETSNCTPNPKIRTGGVEVDVSEVDTADERINREEEREGQHSPRLIRI